MQAGGKNDLELKMTLLFIFDPYRIRAV